MFFGSCLILFYSASPFLCRSDLLNLIDFRETVVVGMSLHFYRINLQFG